MNNNSNENSIRKISKHFIRFFACIINCLFFDSDPRNMNSDKKY